MIGRDLDRQQVADAQQHVAEMRHLTDEAVRAARQLTVELSPPILAGEGLPEAVGWLANQMRDIHNLKVSLEIQGDCHVADRNMRILLFQIIRELLFNVVKHAQVQEASVVLAETDRGIRVTVADEGVGFDVTALPQQREFRTEFGLATIRERLSLFDGVVAVDSAPGQGTSITVSLPLAEPKRRMITK